MKYLDLPRLIIVNNALNFDTDAYEVMGECNIFTTKAAGPDKNLYKEIEDNLQQRHRQLLASTSMCGLTPKELSRFSNLNLARNSPFGCLNDAPNRRKFIYVCATLNNTHRDLDYSKTLHPDDFSKKSVQDVIQHVDSEMSFLRPLSDFDFPAGWDPSMWLLIDEEMHLHECECYYWDADYDPYDTEDTSSIWRHHYFLYNKKEKRVCHLNFRGVNRIANSPERATSFISRVKMHHRESNERAGAKKRASFWFGNRSNSEVEAYGDDEELDDMVIDHPEEEVVDAEEVITVRERQASVDYYVSDEDDSDVEWFCNREEDAVRIIDDAD